MGNSNPAQYKLNIKELQQFQDIISSVTNLFMFCVGSDGNRITEMSGDPLETKRILGLVDENQMISVIGRVLGTSLEEQVIEDTAYPNVKIASIGVTVGAKPAFCWFICGVLNNDESAMTESFSDGLLEYPQYSRPEVWHDMKVPDVLMSGHHLNVEKWRFEQSLLRTKERRPDLYEKFEKTHSKDKKGRWIINKPDNN